MIELDTRPEITVRKARWIMFQYHFLFGGCYCMALRHVQERYRVDPDTSSTVWPPRIGIIERYKDETK